MFSIADSIEEFFELVSGGKTISWIAIPSFSRQEVKMTVSYVFDVLDALKNCTSDTTVGIGNNFEPGSLTVLT